MGVVRDPACARGAQRARGRENGRGMWGGRRADDRRGTGEKRRGSWSEKVSGEERAQRWTGEQGREKVFKRQRRGLWKVEGRGGSAIGTFAKTVKTRKR